MACNDIIAESGDVENEHRQGDGWYSHAVLQAALQRIVPPLWALSLQPLRRHGYDEFVAAADVIGAVVNQDNVHWSAIVKHAGSVWDVDSSSQPVLLDAGSFSSLIHRFRNVFPITLQGLSTC
jgi:hypothetical protein